MSLASTFTSKVTVNKPVCMCVCVSQEALTVRPSDATLLGFAQPCLSHMSVTHGGLMKATAALIHVDAFTNSTRHCSFSLNLHTHLHFQLRNWTGHWFSVWRRGPKCTYFCLMSTKSTIKGKLDFCPRVVLSEPGLSVQLLFCNRLHLSLQWQCRGVLGQSQQPALGDGASQTAH